MYIYAYIYIYICLCMWEWAATYHAAIAAAVRVHVCTAVWAQQYEDTHVGVSNDLRLPRYLHRRPRTDALSAFCVSNCTFVRVKQVNCPHQRPRADALSAICASMCTFLLVKQVSWVVKTFSHGVFDVCHSVRPLRHLEFVPFARKLEDRVTCHACLVPLSSFF